MEVQNQANTMLFNFLEVFPLRWAGGKRFVPLTPPPKWVEAILSPHMLARREYEFNNDVGFLDNFVIDAIVFWKCKEPGSLRSGIWTEADEEGKSSSFEAIAIYTEDDAYLVLEKVHASKQDYLDIYQRAREHKLELELVKKYNNALHAIPKNSADILEAFPDLVVKVFADGRVVEIMATKALDNPILSSVQVGSCIQDVFPGSYEAEIAQTLLKAIRKKSTEVLEISLRMGHEKTITYELRVVQSSDQDCLVIVRDITERKKSEQQLQALAEHLDRKNKELEEFAYIASHDLREPLQKVQLFINLLKREIGQSLTAESQEYMDIVLKSCQKMLGLVKDLLEFATSTKDESYRESVALDNVAQDVLRDLSLQLEMVDAEIKLAQLPIVQGNQSQLSRVFQNLISNAIKFRHPEKRLQILIDCRKSEDKNGEPIYELHIRDNGIGFDSQEAEKIFDFMYRLPRDQQILGSGLGLAICRKVIKQHGGTIHAYSVPNRGATICFTLPHTSQR